MNTKPIHIVMTPTRNEAWVIRAFLESTTRWADYVIICDQMSTDGTREIVAQYAQQSLVASHLDAKRLDDSHLDATHLGKKHHCEVIMIDNMNPEFNEAERQRILVAKAREVAAGRDTLLWGLDADEILAANAFDSEDWQRILNSKPGAVFWFQWAQLMHDRYHYFDHHNFYPWLFHDDGITPHACQVRAMHSMRIPYPSDERDMTYVEGFRVLHLGPAPLNRVRAKERFYMFVDWQVNKRSTCTLYRSYVDDNAYPNEQFELPEEWIYTQDKDGWSLWENVQLDEPHCWMDDYIYERLDKYPMRTLAKLPVWTPEFMSYYHIRDPRPWYVRLFHRYFELSHPYRKYMLVRAMDKLLKQIV